MSPTLPQIEAGNYKKKHIRLYGLEISIENPAGSTRRGIDPGGKPWSTRMHYDYGYIRGTKGVDKDHVDCYIGKDHDAEMVYVIHQRKVGAWDRFDEDKCMLGFPSIDEAKRAFLMHYDDKRFLGPITSMPVDEFKSKVLATAHRPAMIKAGPITLELNGKLFHVHTSGELLVKAMTEPGTRWITIHPGGNKEAKGVPVLVRESKNGSGTYHVVGGAGGKLNYLHIRGVRSEEEYKKEAADRHSARVAMAADRRKKDKELGIYKQKQEAKRAVVSRKQEKQSEFVANVAEKLGWTGHQFDESAHAGLSEAAKRKAQSQHNRKWLKAAHEAVDHQRKWLLADADARREAIDSLRSGNLSMDDIDPAKPKTGLGYSPGYKQAATEAGLTENDIAQARADVMAKRDPDEVSAIEKRKAASQAIRQELESLRPDKDKDGGPQSTMPSPADAAALIKLEAELKSYERQANEVNRKNEAAEDKNAFVVDIVGAPVDVDLEEDLAQDLRTMSAKSLLDTVDRDAVPEVISRHYGVGAYNALQSVALHVSGDGLIDRRVMDVLGVSGAAQVLARRLYTDLSEREIEDLRAGLEQYHADHQADRVASAMREAEAAKKEVDGIHIGSCETAEDLQVAQELNRRRIEVVERAQQSLGGALGELEMNGAMVWALRKGKRDKLQATLGDISIDDAMTRAAAIGLRRGEYSIERAGTQQVLTVTGAGMDRLARKVDRDHLVSLREADAITRGDRDEDGWLPAGVANRPDLAMDISPGVAPRLAEPFDPSGDISQAVKNYIGGRTADGDLPADIMADLMTQETMSRIPEDEIDGFVATMNELAPAYDGDKKLQSMDAHKDRFEQLADEFVKSRYGSQRSALHRQQVPIDQVSVDALHRALAENPRGVAAYKDIESLDDRDQRALRDAWWEQAGKSDPRSAELRSKLVELENQEPEKYLPDTTQDWIDWHKEAQKLSANVDAARVSGDMAAWQAAQTKQREHAGGEPGGGDIFAMQGISDDWRTWRQERDRAAADLSHASINWTKYVEIMGGRPQAYAAVQDLIRSKVAASFADVYNRRRPEAPIKVGRATIRNGLDHLSAIDPELREKRIADFAANRGRDRLGRWAEGSMHDMRLQREAFEQAQMGLFGGEDDFAPQDKPLDPDQRHSLGHALERQLAGMMPIVGKNFDPDQPVKIWNASMSGKNILGQRAIKLIGANKRVQLALGMGTGKTAIGLGGFTHLHSQGKAKKGLFLAPSSVVGQFGAEALRYLEPGKYSWLAKPGASREERLAAYRNPETHFSVVSHQAFRDDLLHLGAAREGVDTKALSDRLDAMTPKQRQSWANDLMQAEGINHDYLFVDEGHQLLNRAGKQNSALANVVDAVSANTPYYVSSTADPVRNDTSEVFDALHKLDPDRYADRDAFMRQYGVNTLAAKHELRREMSRYMIAGSLDPGVGVTRREITVPLHPAQKAALNTLDGHLSRARVANLKGETDVEAVKAISPGAFDGQPEGAHLAIASRLQKDVGLIKEAAIRKEIDDRGQSAKLDHVASLADERRGMPGVVFAHHIDAAKDIVDKLRSGGHRVSLFHGGLSAKDRESARLSFQPEAGDAKSDILVVTDAGATGLNLQRGRWMVQYDTPQTAKDWRQRQGRIHRQGQKNPVELIDLVADHASELAARRRLLAKDQLRNALTDSTVGRDDTGLGGYLNRSRIEEEQDSLF